MTFLSIDKLRRSARALKKEFTAEDKDARRRVWAVFPGRGHVCLADALHVVARETGYESWSKLKFQADAARMDRSERITRLTQALAHGQHWIVRQLLADDPDLGTANLGLSCALYDVDAVRYRLGETPDSAVRNVGTRTPILHLVFSKHIHGDGREADMLQVADLLLTAGADVNDVLLPGSEGSPLSALYGALGHANNMPLAAWLLKHGANPNDGESLYHATELGHHDGLRLLLDHGAKVTGTNAIPRALDFNDHQAVELLLAAGGDPNEGIAPHPSGEPSFVIPALHQAARRMCDRQMFDILLRAGASAQLTYQGMSAYAFARVYGNHAATSALKEVGGDPPLSSQERLLAFGADGALPDGVYIDPAKLPDACRTLIHTLIPLDGRLPHIKRLVAIGAEYDRADDMGLTPVQLAGWEGMPDMMAYFLSLKPDLSHINGYGGTLLSAIIHGSENCPKRDVRDHIECARLALKEGVALPRPALRLAGNEDMAAFLLDWASAYPGQVVEKGIG